MASSALVLIAVLHSIDLYVLFKDIQGSLGRLHMFHNKVQDIEASTHSAIVKAPHFPLKSERV